MATFTVVIFILLFGYSLGVEVFAFRMRPHLRDPYAKEFRGPFRRRITVLDFFAPWLFTDEGNRIRRMGA